MKDPQPVAQPTPTAPLVQPVVSAPLTQHAAPQVQYVTYEVHGPTAQRRESGLGVTVRTLGIIALSLMLVGIIPCLGWLNYLNIVLSVVTIVLAIVALASAKSDAERTSAFLGLGFVVMAVFVGIARLIVGGGCL